MTQIYNANTAASVTATAQQILLPLIRKVMPGIIARQILGVQPIPDSAGTLFTLKPKYQSKYKFSRANWYVAEFDDRYYFEVEVWCAEQFGPHPKNPDAWSRWVHKYENKIHFRDAKDYEWFVLRWS